MKFLFVILLIVTSETAYLQTKLICHETPLKWHRVANNRISELIEKSTNNLIQSQSDSISFYHNMGANLANLGYCKDTVFYYFDKAIGLDPYEGCKYFLAHEEIMPNSKNGMYLKKVSELKYLTIYRKCKNYIEKVDNNEILELKSDTSLNQELIISLEEMMENDQKYRIAADYYKQLHLDSINQILLDSILINYGYPGASLVGDFFSEYASIILLHCDISFQKKALKYQVSALKQSELAKFNLYYALDRIHHFEKGCQLFGTQSTQDETGNLNKVPFCSQEEKRKVLILHGLEKQLNR